MIDISKQIADNLKAYTNEVEEILEEAIVEVAKDTATTLRSTSPKDTGKYAKGWTSSPNKRGGRVIRNKNKPQITHLLELGHAKRGGGRVSGKPHILPARDAAAEELERRVRGALRR